MIEPNDTVKDQFIKWLSSKMSSAQLSDLYLAYADVEDFCLKTKVLKRPLFQTTDIVTLGRVKQIVESNKAFRFIHKKKLKQIYTAIHFYYAFIKENRMSVEIKDNEAKERLKGNIESQEINTDIQATLSKEEITRIISVVNLKEPSAYEFTSPVSLEYFGEIHGDLKSWTQLYVSLVKYLHADYPNVIHGLKGKSLSEGGLIDIGDKYCIRSMEVPKKIVHDVYLETNLSVTNIIKKIRCLLNLCFIEHDNVVIICTNTEDSNTRQKDDSNYFPSISLSNTASQKVASFYKWLSEKQGFAEATSRAYASAVKRAEKYAKKHRLASMNLINTTEYREAQETVDTLFRDENFVEYNKKYNNRFSMALNRYLLFLQEGEHNSIMIKEEGTKIDLNLYEELLADKFQKGFRMDSKLDLKRFKRFYVEKYGEELKVDDNTIQHCIRCVGIQYERLIYLPNVMLGLDKKLRLLDYIEGNFSSGKKAIYYEAIFREFMSEFHGEHIYNVDMLKTYLAYINTGKYYLDRNYIAKDKLVEVDPVEDVRECMAEHRIPMNLLDLYDALPHIPSKKIKQILNFNKEFIYNAPEEYFFVDALELSNEDLEDISEIIQQAIDAKEFMGGNELIEAIKQKYPVLIERLAQFSSIGLRDAIGYKLKDIFSFNGNIISKREASLSMYDVYANYSKSHSHFTLDELNMLKKELNTNIYFDAVYSNALRISQNEFVSKKQAQFDIEKIDIAIDRYCTGVYIAVGDIRHFGSFPHAGFPWNCFLLEHYVSEYSASYKLLHTSFNANVSIGAIVKRDAGIDDFNDLIIDVLVNSEITLNEKDALQYLCDKGYLARRRYGDISQIIINAKVQRTQKGVHT